MDTDEAQKSISATEKKAETLGGKLGSMVGTAAKWGAGIATAGVAATGAMIAFVNKTSQAADEIDKMSIRTGISRTQLQELRFAAGQVGVSFGAIQTSVARMTQSMGKADEEGKAMAKAFARLGVVTHDTSGEMRSADDVFNETLRALAGMENASERNALAMEIFGRGATELIPLMDAGADGIDALSQRAHELGIVMSDDAIAANVKFRDSWDEVKQTGGALLQQLATELIPILMRLFDWVSDNMPQIQAVMGSVFEFVGMAVSAFIDVVEWAGGILSKFVSNNTELFEGFANIFGGIIDIIKAIFEGDWAAVWEGAKRVFEGVWNSISEIAKGAINGIIGVLNTLIRGINKLKFDIPKWVPLIGGKSWGINIPEIPKLAKGGDITREGAVMVGEKGPEILNLPRGARVTPLDKQQTVHHTFGTLTVKGVTDKGELVAIIESSVTDMIRRGVRRGG